MLAIMMRVAALMIILVGAAFSEESMEDVVKRTDMGNADAVYELAEWCASNNKLSLAHKYYLKVLTIDKDHEATRFRLGQVKVNGHWMGMSQVPGNVAKPVSAGGPQGVDELTQPGTNGPGPTASKVAWDLTLPPPSGDNDFVDAQIERMNHAKSDSDDMDSAVLTLLRADSRPFLVRHLCVALKRPDFNDIYGACQIMQGLLKAGKRVEAKTILPFVVTCSAHITDPDGLGALCYIGPLLRDRRIVPRLIELLDSSDATIKDNAAQGLAQVTMLPAKQLTPARAKAWWDRNWNVPEQQVLGEQLRSSDLSIAMAAAVALYDLRDKSIVPVVIKGLKSDNVSINNQAASLIIKITGTDWSYSSEMKPEEKAKIATSLEKWWKENSENFKWIADQQAEVATGPTKKVDPLVETIHQLASVEGHQSESASSMLLSKGNGAVPILIFGLRDPSPLVRIKCNDLLKSITKQDFKFNARADGDEMAKSIGEWRTWAKAHKIALLPDPDDEPADAPDDKTGDAPEVAPKAGRALGPAK